MFKLETHIHTKYSHDSIMPFWLLYIKCRLLNINYIAITEHNNIRGGVAFQKYCKEKGDKVQVIVGEEIMTTQGELIGLFLHDEISVGMSPQDTIKAIRQQKGLVYIPHPYDKKRYKTVLKEECIADNVSQIDFMECYNGRNISIEYTNKQNKLCEKYQIPKIIGSDAHTIWEIGRNYMLVPVEPDNPINFKKAMKKAQFYRKPCLKICHQLTKITRVIKLLQKGDINGLCRIINKKLGRKM